MTSNCGLLSKRIKFRVWVFEAGPSTGGLLRRVNGWPRHAPQYAAPGRQIACKLCAPCQYLPELHKGAHDRDVDLHSLLAMQDAR